MREVFCMITHLFTDLFEVLIFENNEKNKKSLKKVIELPNNLLLNQELLNFYLDLKEEFNLSLNVFTSAFYLINKNSTLTKKYLTNFDQVYSSYSLGYSKKEPQSFKLICNQEKVKPEQCLFIDDKKIHVQAAQQTGFQAYQYLSNEQIKTVLKNISQL